MKPQCLSLLLKNTKLLPDLNFPKYPIRLRKTDKEIQVFDVCRKKWVILNPEEWVRQHLIHFLVQDRNFPLGLIGIEKQIQLNNTLKRPDIIAFDNKTNPIFIAECKAPDVKLTEDVLQQAARYNLVLNVKCIVLSNGLQHQCLLFDNSLNRLVPTDDIPDFKTLTN